MLLNSFIFENVMYFFILIGTIDLKINRIQRLTLNVTSLNLCYCIL